MEYWKSLIFRLVFVFFPVAWIYSIMFYPTIYSASFLFDSVVMGNVVIIGSYAFRFIEACIAPYTYYFILLLVLFCKDLTWRKRVRLVIFGWLIILVVNVVRIIVLIYIALNYGMGAFDAVHLIWWKFMSGVFVALVWIFLVYKFKVRSVPVYDDVKYLVKKIKGRIFYESQN